MRLDFSFETAFEDDGNTNISDGGILINLLLQALEDLRLQHACRVACHFFFLLVMVVLFAKERSGRLRSGDF